MAKETKRTNDLYCRDMPSAKTIEEIKHLAAVKRVKVGTIVHREHRVVNAIRALVAGGDGSRLYTPTQLADLTGLLTKERIG